MLEMQFEWSRWFNGFNWFKRFDQVFRFEDQNVPRITTTRVLAFVSPCRSVTTSNNAFREFFMHCITYKATSCYSIAPWKSVVTIEVSSVAVVISSIPVVVSTVIISIVTAAVIISIEISIIIISKVSTISTASVSLALAVEVAFGVDNPALIRFRSQSSLTQVMLCIISFTYL